MSETLILNADGQPLSQVPLSVITWQNAIRLVFQGKATVLKSYDDWKVRSQHLEMNVPSIIIMSEQAKWSKNLKYSRANVYLRDNFTCQLQITGRCRDLHGKVKVTELTLDHILPKSFGGKTSWMNVCTSCKDCNSEKGNDASIVPRKKPHKPTYYEILAKRKALPIHIRDAEWRYYLNWPDELIKVIPQPTGFVNK